MKKIPEALVKNTEELQVTSSMADSDRRLRREADRFLTPTLGIISYVLM